MLSKIFVSLYTLLSPPVEYYTFTQEQIHQIRSIPINYPNARTTGDDRLFIWNGTNVHVNKTILEERLYYTNDTKIICAEYNTLLEIMNKETIAQCRHCHLYDYVSLLVQNIEHHRYECHMSHYKELSTAYSDISTRRRKDMIWPDGCYNRLGSILQHYSHFLRTDLGISTLSKEEIEILIESTTTVDPK